MEAKKEAPAQRLWHTVTADALTTELRTNSDAGLSAEEAGRRQTREGFNELP